MVGPRRVAGVWTPPVANERAEFFREGLAMTTTQKRLRTAVERELAAKKAEEARVAAAAEKARKAAERAPDNEKLRFTASLLRQIPLPTVTSTAAKVLLNHVQEVVKELALELEAAASSDQ